MNSEGPNLWSEPPRAPHNVRRTALLCGGAFLTGLILLITLASSERISPAALEAGVRALGAFCLAAFFGYWAVCKAREAGK